MGMLYLHNDIFFLLTLYAMTDQNWVKFIKCIPQNDILCRPLLTVANGRCFSAPHCSISVHTGVECDIDVVVSDGLDDVRRVADADRYSATGRVHATPLQSPVVRLWCPRCVQRHQWILLTGAVEVADLHAAYSQHSLKPNSITLAGSKLVRTR